MEDQTETVEEPRVVGDTLPKRSRRANGGSGKDRPPPAGPISLTDPAPPLDDPGPEPDPEDAATTAADKRSATRRAARTTTPKEDVSKPARASKTAIEAAGDLYALIGTAASVGGFEAAGIVMQSQKDDAGKILANHALAQWPRMYSFLESSAKASAIVPLIVAPIAADLYMRTSNPQLEVLCAGILSQMLKGAKVQVPDPNAEDGSGLTAIDVWPALAAHKSAMFQEAQAQAQAAPPPPDPGPVDMDGPPPVSSNGTESGHDSPAARAVRGEGWRGEE